MFFNLIIENVQNEISDFSFIGSPLNSLPVLGIVPGQCFVSVSVKNSRLFEVELPNLLQYHSSITLIETTREAW